MDAYLDFWRDLIFGDSHTRYWVAYIIAACLSFVAGRTVKSLAPLLSVIVLVIFVAIFVPTLVWVSSCPSCTWHHDSARSINLLWVQVLFSSFFATSIAAIWLGVLSSQFPAAWNAVRRAFLSKMMNPDAWENEG